MPTLKYTAFYPSRPFWAVSPVNFDVPQGMLGWLNEQMSEKTFMYAGDGIDLSIARDGRIEIRIAELERLEEPADSAPPPIEETVKRWGAYLDYLNTYYLLLDSSTIEIDRTSIFNLHEVTNRDAFRVRYENGSWSGENIAVESIAAKFQMGRHASNYPAHLPIQADATMLMRQVVTVAAIEHATATFLKVVAIPGLQKTMAGYAKSLAEYKVGNYETAIVLAWFVVESAITRRWKQLLNAKNTESTNGKKRINRERLDFLTGRDFTASVVTNILELSDSLTPDHFEVVDQARGYRNKIVHQRDFSPGQAEAQIALKAAQNLIAAEWDVKFTPNLSYSIAGM